MNTIHRAESMGHFLQVEGGQLTVEKAAEIPADLLQELQEKKTAVMEALERDKKMKRIGATIGIPGEIYTWSLSPYSSIFVERARDRWELYRMNHYANRPPYIKVIAAGTTFKYIRGEAKRYIEYLSKDKSK
ncbi:hypothetical protein [Bhargavaea beijingensis]|uniref:Bacteriophage HK97-gp10, tail-component n=1 Tax=Bhargavaea beijingensis TaxID=426756 RepID=A0ABX9ZCU5_9BACL|nr:hypothetical protein [Bhargavaea beijingensis]RSK30973.1 hypothetical protein EJA12_09660 [Bhargavaea beijingensis]